MHAAFPPGTALALLEAAEEALAVFAVKALVGARVLKLLPVDGVVECDDGVRRPHVQHRVVLLRNRIGCWREIGTTLLQLKPYNLEVLIELNRNTASRAVPIRY